MNKKNKQAMAKLKNLMINHNWSWIKEVYEQNKNNLDSIALYYKGEEITYEKLLYRKRLEYANALKHIGINSGTSIPVCMSNVPEFIYLLAGISTIGAKFNSFSNDFDPNYIKEIINDCDSDTLFVSSDMYLKLKNIISETHIKRIVFIEVNDDLNKDQMEVNRKIRLLDEKVIGLDTFLRMPTMEKNYRPFSMHYFEDVNGYDNFSTTYLENDSKTPIAIAHDSLSYAFQAGNYNDTNDVILNNQKRVLVHMPTYLNESIIKEISSSLINGDTVVLEPVYKVDNFFNSIVKNKPNVVTVPKTFWLVFAKNIFELNDSYFNSKNISEVFKNLRNLFSNELLSKEEENFINRALKRAGATTKISTSLFVPKIGTWYKDSSKVSLNGGFNSLSSLELAVLGCDGEKLKKGKIGRVVVNDEYCDTSHLREYKNAKLDLNDFYLWDNQGMMWLDLHMYGYIDRFNKAHLKGKTVERDVYPPFLIADVITSSTNEILSCEVVPVTVDDKIYYVATMELNPLSLNLKNNFNNFNFNQLIYNLEMHIRKVFPDNISESVLFRFLDNNKSFPLTKSGKIDLSELKSIGIENTIKVFSESSCDMELLNLKYLMKSPMRAFKICDGKSYVESRKLSENKLVKKKVIDTNL